MSNNLNLAVLEKLSKKLTNEFGKGFSERNLERMRRFYICFPISTTVSSKLSWSHYLELIKIEEEKKNLELNENNIINKTDNQNIFLIHGYNGIPKIYEWLENKLKKMGYNVITPKFETRGGVIYENWKKTFDNYRKYIDDESIVVAHSIGNEFIIKYFNENNLSAKLYISLAGFSEYFEWKDKEDLNRACKEFLVNKEELENFRNRCGKKYSIYSNNDHIVPFEILQAYPKSIDATPILIENIGHMGKKSGLEEIPKVIELIEATFSPF